MSEGKKCPECGSTELKKIIKNRAVGPGDGSSYPKEQGYPEYKCLTCGRESPKDELID